MTTAPSRPVGAGAPRPKPVASPKAFAQAGGPSIDPFRVLRRYMLVLIAMSIVGAAVGVGAYLALDRFAPKYTGDVLFKLQPGLPNPTQIGAFDIQTEEQVVRMARTEAVLLLGRDVLQSALVNNQSSIEKTTWSQKFRDESGRIIIPDAVDDLVSTLDATHVRNTNLLRLSWSSSSLSDVPEVLSAVSKTYIDLRKSRETASFNRDKDTFNRQLQAVETSISDTNTAIQTFIGEKSMVSIDSPQFSQVNSAAVEASDVYARVLSDQSAAHTRLEQTGAKVQGTLAPTDEDQRNVEMMPEVQVLKRTINDLGIELESLKKSYAPTHPEVRRFESRLEAAQNEYDRTFKDKMHTYLFAEYNDWKAKAEQLDRLVIQAEKDYNDKAQRLVEMTRSVETYKGLETRRNRLEEQRSELNKLLNEIELLKLRSDADRVVIAQEALPPREKSFPSWRVIIPLSTLLFFALTLGAVFLRELTDQRVKSAADLAVVSGSKVLGVIPDLEDDPTKARRAELVVRDAPDSVVAESFRHTSALLSKAIEQQGIQSVLVVSGLPGSGSSTVISNLAAAQAAGGKRVLILEANFRRPSLSNALGAKPTAPGLGDLLAGSSTMDEAVQDIGSGVHFISAGTAANRVFERLATNRFPALRAQMSEKYDLVLVDVPPVVVASDGLVLASRVDASILVVRANQEQRGLVARIINQLNDMPSQFLGVVLNRPRGTVGGYYKRNFEAMAAYSKG